VAIVDRGRIISEGSPRALIAALGADHVIEFGVGGDSERDLRPTLEALPAVTSVRREAGNWLLVSAEPHRALPALITRLQSINVPLERLATRQATLEDVFVALTGRSLRED
jgi:ABC-2 type transport system ATP-binding protein